MNGRNRLYQISILTVILICGFASGYGQDHFQLHIALTGMFHRSTGLDQFTSSYNTLNQAYLVRSLDGMQEVFGWRWGVGYRHFDRFNFAFMIGMYQVGSEDQARFSNGERREFILDITSPFVELDAGFYDGTFLFNGLLTFYFNRQIRLETGYVSFDPSDRPLDGVYRGDVDLAIDMGAMAGMVKYPFLITLKLSYPVYSSHDGETLTNGIAEFPSDYFSYVGKGEYPGLSSDIDGFKVFVTLGYLFQF